MKNDNLCIREIDEYGPCGRRKDHIVHSMLGISPREHTYLRPSGRSTKTVTLTKENVEDVSKESGQSIDELKMILEVAESKNKDIMVRYELPEETLTFEHAYCDPCDRMFYAATKVVAEAFLNKHNLETHPA